MIRPVLRLMWKGSTGIPRLLVSCIRTMAAPPSGMCLIICKPVDTISEQRLTLAFSLLPHHRSYQSNSRSPSLRRVHRCVLDESQSNYPISISRQNITHGRSSNYWSCNLEGYDPGRKSGANRNWIVCVTYNVPSTVKCIRYVTDKRKSLPESDLIDPVNCCCNNITCDTESALCGQS